MSELTDLPEYREQMTEDLNRPEGEKIRRMLEDLLDTQPYRQDHFGAIVEEFTRATELAARLGEERDDAFRMLKDKDALAGAIALERDGLRADNQRLTSELAEAKRQLADCTSYVERTRPND